MENKIILKAKKNKWVVCVGNADLGNLQTSEISSVRGSKIRIFLNSYVRPIIRNESIIEICNTEDEAYTFINSNKKKYFKQTFKEFLKKLNTKSFEINTNKDLEKVGFYDDLDL